MKTIYLDADYMCHLENGEGRTETETDVFDGMQNEIIPFYRFVPQGSEWVEPKTRLVIKGEFIQATDSNKIDRIVQDAYIRELRGVLNILTGEAE